MGNAPLKIITAILGAFILIVALYAWYGSAMITESTTKTERIRIGERELVVFVADTLALQAKGLGGRESLARDYGMLFSYGEKAILNFWMKDMQFPIDVLWVADGSVVGVSEHIQIADSNGSVTRFNSPVHADAVIEVQAGWIERNNITIGDAVVMQ